ncbi:conjugal transfer protein TraG N-terminal domain-containing protein [Epibacterium sp. Ofav1-8]|uniref:conjugal transfer protein TraG N-terminal domain-containing protein n=1 Tax=Epibacterium sp. Ofav1-8 TaxID=2917735 RepID=UPI001EF62DCC|nr:conjugal transfer protein TraG N-terminal domain-containing protein [Epibacterium sp. Ofav1-8]MCG7625923.1 conjugal transfer protein TraG N-terminal domain-containing protein [Epibacterium sp. Ofav1-8]
MPEFEIHTVGGGYYLYDVFNYLSAFTGSGNFEALLYAGIVAGVLVGALQMAIFGAVRQVGTYIIGTVLVLGIGIGPKARVIIMDSTVPLGVYGAVGNVPWSVAWVGSLTSRAGAAMTDQMETLLAAPDNLTYQKSGMMFGSTIMSQAARWRAVTPIVHEGLVNFMENCMVDGANIGLVDTGELGNSGNLDEFISDNVPNSLAYFDPVLEETTLCSDGWPQIQTRIANETNNILYQKAASQFGVRSGPDLAANKMRATLSDFQNFIGMTSAGAAPAIQQTMLINSMDGAIQRLIASSGNNAAMTSYQAARTEAQTSASYSAVGISALKWVPLLKIVFEAIYYASFPLAMIMMMTPMVWNVMKGYFGGFVWLAAWDPISAILHSIVMKASSGYYREAMGSFSSGSLEFQMSFANYLGVRAVEQDVGTIAGYLMMSVPFMATVVLFGATRMAGLATSMLNVSQGAAIESGREAATGNISLANASMNNFAANKWNTSSVFDAGAHTTRMANGAMRTVNADGSAVFGAGSAQSSGGMSTRVGQTIREEVQDRREEAVRNATSLRDEWSSALNETAANYADFGRSLTNGTSVSNDHSTSQGHRRQEEAREAHSAVESFAKEHGISLDAAYKVAISAGAKAGSGAGGTGLSAGLDGAIAGTGLDQDAYRTLQNAARESGLSETVSKYGEAVNAIRASSSSSQTDTESGGDRWSVEDVRRKGETYAEAREEAETLSAAETHLYSQGISYDGQLTDAIIGEWREAGASDEQISAWLNPKSTSGVKAQEAAVERVLPNLMSELGLDSPNRDLASAHTLRRPEDQITERPLPSAGVDHQREYNRVKGATENVSTAMDGRRESLETNAKSNATDNERAVVEGQDFGVVPGAVKKVATTVGDVADSVSDAWHGASAAITGRPNISNYDRDVMIRTIAGEAGRESDVGQAGVAHVIMNRVQDPRWGDNPAEVSLQLKQFSAWNGGAGGNSIPERLEEGSVAYERIGRIVDGVASGNIPDPTGGATHYYSPQGMQQLVRDGHQSNDVPDWLPQTSSEREHQNVTIGGHIFSGRARTAE